MQKSSFKTDAQNPNEGKKLKPADFCAYISHEKDRDYEDNWVKWEEYRKESSASAYEHELAIVLRTKDFPNLHDEGLVEKLKLFEREYQSRLNRIQIIAKFGGDKVKRLWYLQGE